MVLTTAMNMQVFWDVAVCHWTESSLMLIMKMKASWSFKMSEATH